jgi:H+/Cl- antiporter ClcA
MEMWTQPRSWTQKVGIVIYGLVVGAGTALGTSAACLVLGIAVSWFAQSTGWIHLGENQPWLPLIGMEYGFFLGVAIGAFVCWKVWRSRFQL